MIYEYINIVAMTDIKNPTSRQAVKAEEAAVTHGENLNHLTQFKLATGTLVLYSHRIWTTDGSEVETKRQQEY